MKKLIAVAVAVMMVIAAFGVAMPAAAGGVCRGEAEDDQSPQLGVIKYLGTPAGYHFWFTCSEDVGHYKAGHSYHNVYQLTVDDTGEWAGPTTIPNRPPYNLVGHPPGTEAYYKIIDTTTDTQVWPLP